MLSRLKRRLFTAVFETKTVPRRDLEGRKIVSTDSVHLTSGRTKEKEPNVDSLRPILLLSRHVSTIEIDLERERNNSQLFAKQFSPVSIGVECITPIRVERRNYDKKIQWVLGSNRVWIKPGDLVAMRQVGYRETKRFQRDERGRWLWLP